MVDVRLEAGSAQSALQKALDTASFPDDAVGVQVVDTVARSNSRGPEYEDITVYLIEFIRDD